MNTELLFPYPELRDNDSLDEAERQATELLQHHGLRPALARTLAANLRTAGLLAGQESHAAVE